MDVIKQLREWAEKKTVLRLRVHGKEYPTIIDKEGKWIIGDELAHIKFSPDDDFTPPAAQE